jgi:hypothetical protein
VFQLEIIECVCVCVVCVCVWYVCGVCVCVCVVCPALLHDAAGSLFKPDNHMLCHELCPVLLSRKKMSKSIATRNT